MKKQNKEEAQKTQEEFNLTKALRDWRSERNIITIDRATYVKQVIEEIFELYLDDKKAIDKNTEVLYNTWFLHLERNELKEEDFVDVLQDIQVFSINANELLGYDNIQSSNEVYKHISCRKQDPKQKADWEKNGSQGKWQKDKEQSEDELYEPNYRDCKFEM